MGITLNFRVALRPIGNRILLHVACISSEERMRKLLLHYWGPVNGPIMQHDRSLAVNCEETDPRLPFIYRELKEEGWEPTFDVRFTDLTQKLFRLRRTRGRDLKEEKAAEFLMGFPEKEGGYVRSFTPPHTAHVECEGEDARRTTGVISVFGKSPMLSAWTEAARAEFHKAGLKGGVFRPLEWKPCPQKKVQHPCWLDAEQQLPRSLTPRIVNGKEINSNEELAALSRVPGQIKTFAYEDECFVDYRLAYRRADLAKFAGIDVLASWEEDGVGTGEISLPSHYIYSQRFRLWANKQGYKFSWRPLKVVD